jgi:hypothetical protein
MSPYPSRATGLSYLDLMRLIHWRLLPRTYLEIGVFQGATLELAAPGTRVIGVDPWPRVDRPLPANVTVFRQTSDEFFGRADLPDLLAGQPVDLGFIDGMHLFEFALRDFMQIERHAHRGATILVHDCYPVDEASARRERTPPTWSGDVWKLVPCLRQHRPELRITTLGAAPSGLGVIQGLDPDSRRLDEVYDEVVEYYRDLEYAFLEGNGGKPAQLSYRPVTADVLSEFWPEACRSREPYLQVEGLVKAGPTRLRWFRQRSPVVRRLKWAARLPARLARKTKANMGKTAGWRREPHPT